MAITLPHLWAVIRAVFGVIGAIAVLLGSYFIARRIRGDNSGDSGCTGSAEEIKRGNSDAIKGLENALDILRNARGRASP